MASSSVHASVLQALSTYTTALGGTYTHAIAAVAGALGVPGERGVLAAAALVMSANAVVTFIALLAFIPAPYGKFAVSGGARWGPGVPARVAWLLQEAPSFACAALGWYAAAVAAAGARRAAVTINPSTALLAAFLGHYAYRSFVYPLRIRGGKATPLGIFLLAAAFTTYNGWMQGRYLAAFAPVGGKASAALLAPRFVFGAVLWATGLAVNLHSDHILRTLRKPGETGYQIPRGGAFELVSAANYWGEILEWSGFALAAYSPLPAGFAAGTWLGAIAATPGLCLVLHPCVAFALFTFANIGPRGVQQHAWYKAIFPDYPRDRRAVIPYLW